MKVYCDSLLAGARAARGLAVIIDVFRAFTCAALLISLGIKKSILAATPEEAFALKKQDNEILLIGEIGGIPIEGFDMGNSPVEILRRGRSFFQGKTVVQRTSSGVQGALAALEVADEVLLGSYNTARATAEYIVSEIPDTVSLVAMGWDPTVKAPEDECCARYIAHLLGAGDYDHDEALSEILFQETAQRFLRADNPAFPAEDPVLCLQRDVYNFALRAECNENLVVVRKIESG